MKRPGILGASFLLLLLYQTTLAAMLSNDDEANPPHWPDSVIFLSPDDSVEEQAAKLERVQDPWNAEMQTFTSDHHFSSQRQAVLMAPGVYHNCSFQVGYYTQVLGLGRQPTDVRLAPGPFVPALNKHPHAPHGTSLDSFWRSAENFATTGDLQWAVSQAAPLRRVDVGGDLILHDGAAYASGGFVAHARVYGQVRAGGQQQYLLRHVDLVGGATGGAWSMVYASCSGQVPVAAVGNTTSPSVTVVPARDRVRLEKPYIIQTQDNPASFALVVPAAFQESAGVSWECCDPAEERDFRRVRLVTAEEPVERIQEALDEGKDVVLAPGIFALESTLVFRHSHQVLLGLGLATLQNPPDGTPCIQVEPQVPGVRIAGVMLEASETHTTTLLQWGYENVTDPGDATYPGGLFDVFVRVGGSVVVGGSEDRRATRVDTMMRLHAGHLVGDNLWLWRADHSDLQANEEKVNFPDISSLYWQSEEEDFHVGTGLEVGGDYVTVYGLAVEHANGHQTVWRGNHGHVAFYQCELPYGVSQSSYGDSNFTGYLLDDTVDHHQLYAPGVYSNFRNGPVVTATAIRHPCKSTIEVVNPFTVRLDNHFGIQSIVNDNGSSATEQGQPVRLPHLLDSSASEASDGETAQVS
jgi:hypothetical protein